MDLSFKIELQNENFGHHFDPSIFATSFRQRKGHFIPYPLTQNNFLKSQAILGFRNGKYVKGMAQLKSSIIKNLSIVSG